MENTRTVNTTQGQYRQITHIMWDLDADGNFITAILHDAGGLVHEVEAENFISAQWDN